MIKMSNNLISAEYYAYSPFDNPVVPDEVKITAITMIAVLCLIFVTGLIGHLCVVAFISCSKSRSSTSCFSAYVIIGNLTAAHILYLVTCLPPNAYKSIMELLASEWLFGDVACRLVSFMEMFLLGVTTLSFFAFSVDRFRSAGHVDKGYEIVRDSVGSGICKMLVLWIGALVLASPELLLHETSYAAVRVLKMEDTSSKNVFIFRDHAELPADVHVLTKEEFGAKRDAILQYTLYSFSKTKRASHQQSGSTSNYESNAHRPLELNVVKDFGVNDTANLYVQYDVCISGVESWKETFPAPIYVFIQNYYYFRHWWLVCFYFCLPVFFSLLFALLVSRRLSVAVGNMTDNPQSCAGSYYLTSGIDGGTLTSQREMDRAALMENSNYRTDSLLSNRTHVSDGHYQQRGGHSLDRNVSQSSYAQYQSRLSPLLSCDDLQDASPTIVVSNGSIRTIGSSRRPGELSPQSPISPSLACTSGVSVLSLAMSNTGGNAGGTIGTASLPPHGHRRSIKRSSRVTRQTLSNAQRERALNSVLVSFVLAFTLTQLPLRVVTILQIETSLMSLLDSHYVALICSLCVYFSTLTFMINPIVLCLCYKLYRRFIADRCCCCC